MLVPINQSVGFCRVMVYALCCVSFVALVGCNQYGTSVSKNHARVNGVLLEHKRTIEIDSAVPWESIELKVSSGGLDVQAGDGDEAKLSVTFFEIQPGDAAIEIAETGLIAVSQTQSPVVITGISGTVPNRPIKLRTGSGNVSVAGFHGVVKVDADTGSGNIQIKGVSGLQSLRANTGSGGIQVSAVTDIQNFTARTGSGSQRLVDASGIGSADLSTGSGSIKLTRVVADGRIKLRTGSGGVALSGCQAGDLSAETGSGNIDLQDTTYGSLHTQTGSGKVRHSDKAS